MKSLSWFLAGFLLLGAPGCIYVRVTGDPDEEFWDDDDDGDEAGFHELSAAVEGCLADARFDLDLEANPWHTEADWRVRFAGPGSDGHAAFHRVKEAVLERIQHEGGTLTSQNEDGPHAWSCSFRLDDGPGSASVRLNEETHEDDERSGQLEVSWEQSN